VRRIDNLVKLKTSPDNANGSLLSDDEYARQRSELLKEKSALEELLNDTGHRIEQWVRLAEQTFEFASTAQARFNEGDAATKKEILLTIGSNLSLKDKKFRIEAAKPFFLLENSLSGSEAETPPIEPENVQGPSRRNRANPLSRPFVRRERDSNP
jgi:hypothetical protein